MILEQNDGFPTPACVENALLGPLALSRKSTWLTCVAETPGVHLEHLRPDEADQPVNRLEVIPPEAFDPSIVPLVAGNTIYAGPYLDHFGHAIAECIHRLWAASVFPPLKDANVAFQVAPGQKFPNWFFEILSLCDIPSQRVRAVDNLTQFEYLYIPRQGRALKSAALFPGYDALFPLVSLQRPSERASRLYISRSQHIYSGTYLGESLVERILSKAGFKIIHPEAIPVRELVELLAAADVIVFAEGSAIHNIELCGPIKAKTFVIGRRGGSERHYRNLLGALCHNAVLFPGRRATVFLDWEPDLVTPRRGRACSFSDLPALIKALTDFTGIALPIPLEREINDAVSRDMLAYLLDPRSGIGSNEALGRALRATRDDPEIAQFLKKLSDDF